MKKVYLSGPMSGLPHFNQKNFELGAERLRAWGYEVFSPLERDIERYGLTLFTDNPTGDVDRAAQLWGFSKRLALCDDLNYICLRADMIAMLPGWEKGRGARSEHALAVALDLEILYLNEVP